MSRRAFLAGLSGAGLALVGSPLLLAACGSSSPAKTAPTTSGSSSGTGTGAAATTTKRLRMAQGSAPQTLDADKTRAGTDGYFQGNVYECLLNRNIAGGPVPGLATSYTASPDGTTFTFNLREGATFHNGEPFDANAVKFSFERYVAPATQNVFSFYLANLKSVDALNANTVRITLSKPSGDFIDTLGFAPMVPPQYITKNGSTYFGQHPVGTGPFKFKSYEIGQSWSLDRFDDYWGPKPAYAGLDTQIIIANASRLAALESGQVDFITQVNPTDAKDVESRGITVKSTFSGTAFALFLNMNIKNSPWQKQAVRNALDIAIDRNAIRQALFLGYSIDYSKGLTTYDAGYNLLTYPETAYNPTKAKQLLASAGYPSGFSMDLIGPADGRFVNSSEVLQAIAGQWEEIGVKVNTQLLAYNQWISTISSTGTFNGAGFGDEYGFDPNQFYGLYFGKGAGYSHVEDDPKLDALLATLAIAAPGAPRDAAAAAVATYNHEQSYMLPLYGDDVLYGMKGVDWTPWANAGYSYMLNAVPT